MRTPGPFLCEGTSWVGTSKTAVLGEYIFFFIFIFLIPYFLYYYLSLCPLNKKVVEKTRVYRGDQLRGPV